MVNKIRESIYTIKIRLPKSPLRNLNSYVFCTPERNLIIDTGFDTPECFEDLMAGITELGIDMTKTDILATHYHADHSGLMQKIVRPGCKVYIGEIDKELLEEGDMRTNHWKQLITMYGCEGFPVDILGSVSESNPSTKQSNESLVPLTPLKDGQIIQVGHMKFSILHTPGHTPGHICLYSEDERCLVLGDHILFGITPNITVWPTMPNALGRYMESLKEIRNYDVNLALTAHREYSNSIEERINELLEHHRKRLEETFKIVKDNPGISAYEVAGQMRWSMRGMSWNDFPIEQRWFAMGETLSHLHYLLDKGSIVRQEGTGKIRYIVDIQTQKRKLENSQVLS